ncbi:hypothetical protein DFJ63DRAFT_337501 [Scheffersomyces coipomensis]|uniref:uncharacterized protein n=1 Tax=Scheffersomyces coipomensis TaxID=1788519 RepID=UPI00315CF562
MGSKHLTTTYSQAIQKRANIYNINLKNPYDYLKYDRKYTSEVDEEYKHSYDEENDSEKTTSNDSKKDLSDDKSSKSDSEVTKKSSKKTKSKSDKLNKNPNINVETLRLMKKREKKNKKRRQLRRKNKEAVKQKKQAIEKEDGNKILNITMKEFLPAETISHAAVDNSIGNAARYLLLDNFIKYSQGIKAFIKNNLDKRNMENRKRTKATNGKPDQEIRDTGKSDFKNVPIMIVNKEIQDSRDKKGANEAMDQDRALCQKIIKIWNTYIFCFGIMKMVTQNSISLEHISYNVKQEINPQTIKALKELDNKISDCALMVLRVLAVLAIIFWISILLIVISNMLVAVEETLDTGENQLDKLIKDSIEHYKVCLCFLSFLCFVSPLLLVATALT